MRRDDNKTVFLLALFGIVPVIWLALKTAPHMQGNILEIFLEADKVFKKPLSIKWCSDSIRTVAVFILLYLLVIGIALSMRRNYRRGEEHGSARWG